MRSGLLILSLVLMVALGAGVLARRAQLANGRDVRLTTTSEVALSKITALVGSLDAAAQAGSDPTATARSVERLLGGLGVCAVDGATVVCGGATPRPPDRATPGSGARPPVVVVSDGALHVEAAGPEVGLVATVGLEGLLQGLKADAWVTNSLPEDTQLGQFRVADRQRQYVVAVTHPAQVYDGVYLVAATSDSVRLTGSEQLLAWAIGIVAAGMLAFAGLSQLLAQRLLVERASIDQLTRLPNRSEFERRTTELIAQGDKGGPGFALLLFDLDGFKAVNDTYGHKSGDELLQVVAERMAGGIRGGDLVARWGGDEFVVVMPGIRDLEMAGRRGGQIRELIAARVHLDTAGESVRVGASVGVALWPEHGRRLDDLLAAADTAMYRAKRGGLGVLVAPGPGRIPDTVPYELEQFGTPPAGRLLDER